MRITRNATTRLGLLVATTAVCVATAVGCGTQRENAPQPPPPDPEQVSVQQPVQECPPPGITLRRDPGCG